LSAQSGFSQSRGVSTDGIIFMTDEPALADRMGEAAKKRPNPPASKHWPSRNTEAPEARNGRSVTGRPDWYTCYVAGEMG
jgi:hypothetical protein